MSFDIFFLFRKLFKFKILILLLDKYIHFIFVIINYWSLNLNESVFNIRIVIFYFIFLLFILSPIFNFLSEYLKIIADSLFIQFIQLVILYNFIYPQFILKLIVYYYETFKLIKVYFYFTFFYPFHYFINHLIILKILVYLLFIYYSDRSFIF